jgi:polysaccharide export outer membrane protein
MIRRLLSLFLVALFAVSCATKVATDPRLSNTTLDAYRLDSGDKLRVTVFGQMDLTDEYSVDGSGRVTLPLIDPVSARGQTTEELARGLEAALREKLLRNPSVSVEVTQYRPFFILGEVNQPGQYAYVNGLTVRTAAAIAGGFTYRASRAGVTITRRLDGAMLEGSATMDAPIMPGDTIIVAERLF